MTVRIGEDGTIYDSNIETHYANPDNSMRQNYQNISPPVSPFENHSANSSRADAIRNSVGCNTKREDELKYDLQVVEGKIKSIFPIKHIMWVSALLLIAVMFEAVLLAIIAIIPGVFILIRISQQSKYKAERDRIEQEISHLNK